MEVVEECPLDNLFRSLAQLAASQIQYLSNRKEIGQSFVRIVLENKELHKLFVYRKYHADILSFVILWIFILRIILNLFQDLLTLRTSFY
jgi:hypothetical protein